MGNCQCVYDGSMGSEAVDDERVERFLSRVRPLDLIVFDSGSIKSSIIKSAQKLITGRGDFSHVEVAISREWCSALPDNFNGVSIAKSELLSWGSRIDKNRFGVAVQSLRELVKIHLSRPNSSIAVARLIQNPISRMRGESEEEYKERSEELKRKINRAYNNYKNRKFNLNLVSMAAALFPGLRDLRDKIAERVEDATRFLKDKFKTGEVEMLNNWLFCSEFAARLYIDLEIITDETDGVIDNKILNPANVVPVDFLGADQDEDGIQRPICKEPEYA